MTDETPIEDTQNENSQTQDTPSQYEQNVANALTYVKNVLNISWNGQDVFLTILLKATNSQILNMTWIDLLNGDDEKVEYYDGAGERELFLKQVASKINSIEFIKEQRQEETQRETIPAKRYVLKKSSIVFARPIFRWFQNIKITYKPLFTDFSAIPTEYENLKLALALIVWNLRATSKQSGISSESVSWTSITFDKSTITKDVQILLDDFIIVTI